MSRTRPVSFRLALALALAIAGCGVKRHVDEMHARGTIEAGGYTWQIPVDSEGGNQVQTHGFPSVQAATDASTILCKKYGRVAQYVSQRGLAVTALQIFTFNCVR